MAVKTQLFSALLQTLSATDTLIPAPRSTHYRCKFTYANVSEKFSNQYHLATQSTLAPSHATDSPPPTILKLIFQEMLKKGFFTSYGMQHANQIKISIIKNG